MNTKNQEKPVYNKKRNHNSYNYYGSQHQRNRMTARPNMYPPGTTAYPPVYYNSPNRGRGYYKKTQSRPYLPYSKPSAGAYAANQPLPPGLHDLYNPEDPTTSKSDDTLKNNGTSEPNTTEPVENLAATDNQPANSAGSQNTDFVNLIQMKKRKKKKPRKTANKFSSSFRMVDDTAKYHYVNPEFIKKKRKIDDVEVDEVSSSDETTEKKSRVKCDINGSRVENENDDSSNFQESIVLDDEENQGETELNENQEMSSGENVQDRERESYLDEKVLKHLNFNLSFSIKRNPLVTIIVDKNHPKKKLTALNFTNFKNAVSEEIDTMPFDKWPRFEKSFFKKEIFIIIASDENSKNWLFNHFDNITERSGLSLKIYQINNMFKAKIWVPNNIHGPKTFLHRLQSFNPTLKTNNWYVINARDVDSDKSEIKELINTFVVAFPDSEEKALIRLDYRPYYDLGRLNVKLISVPETQINIPHDNSINTEKPQNQKQSKLKVNVQSPKIQTVTSSSNECSRSTNQLKPTLENNLKSLELQENREATDQETEKTQESNETVEKDAQKEPNQESQKPTEIQQQVQLKEEQNESPSMDQQNKENSLVWEVQIKNEPKVENTEA